MNEHLTLACARYDLTLPLINGEVKPEGIDLNVISNFEPNRIQFIERMYTNSEFDISEYSTPVQYISWDRGDKRFRLIPVFTTRAFFHRNLFVRRDSKIRRPKDLEGKSIAVPIYQNGRWMWTRGVFDDFYGVSTNKIKWFTERPERIKVKLPKAQITRLPEGVSSVKALEDGLVDAIGSFDLQKGKKIVPLFKDPKEEEIKYYRRTKIFPIMHSLAIKNEILERSPWVAQSIMQALQEAKEIAYETRDKLASQAGSINVWNDGLRDQYEVFGEDPFPYGLDVNMPTLESWSTYLLKQGFISKKPDIKSMFAKGTGQVTRRW
ncbi:MAG: hypothetical protein ACE5KG_01625 [Nitrososphaerales archaeon]